MIFETVQLKDVCEFLDNLRVPVEEADRKPGPYPYYGANGQQGWIGGYIFDEPLVLLAEDGGHFGSKTRSIAYKVTGKCWVNNHAHVLRPKPNCDVDYLHRVLSFYDVTRFISGTTRQKLTKGKAEGMPIPLPSLDEQKRIATILSKADRLRRLRRYARELSDGYLQSVFLEMFGDPVSNPKSLKVVKLGDICSRITDGTHQPPKWSEKGIPFLFVSNVADGELDFNTEKFISHETWLELTERCPIELNDILYTIVGSYGNAALVRTTRPFSFQRHIAHIKPNPNKIHPEFLLGMLQSPGIKKQADKEVRGVAQKTLNLSELKNLLIFTPDWEAQIQYVELRRKYERLRAQQRESARQGEHLFQSLLHRAFRGEM
jgi:type I restriction enzyme, S subunit